MSAVRVVTTVLLGVGMATLPTSSGLAQELTITLVGNAGIVLSDDSVSLLVDLPHEPGAFGYARYDPSALDPPGEVVSVITHGHRDHFAAELFLAREDWRVIGPSQVLEGLPPDRVLEGSAVSIGAFTVTAVPTPHAPGHRSYSIGWRGRSLHVTGDTEDGSTVMDLSALDILFLSPWLACSLAEPGRRPAADRTILYHLRPDASDRACGTAELLPRGRPIRLRPAAGS